MNSPKPLRGKIMFGMLVYSDNSNFGDRDTVIEQYQTLAKDVKSAVEFYKKYKGLTLFNYEEYKDCEYTDELWELYTSTEHPVMSFRDWLFGYCFGDVIE